MRINYYYLFLCLHCSLPLSLKHQTLDISIDTKMPPHSVKEGAEVDIKRAVS